MGIRVNKVEYAVDRVLVDHDEKLWVRANSLDAWRIKRPRKTTPFVWGDETFYPLDRVSGVTYRFLSNEQVVEIAADSNAYFTTILKNGNEYHQPTPPSLGMFLNYDLLGGRTYVDAAPDQRLDGSFEAGLFSKLGVATTTYLGQDLTSAGRGVRLESSWTHDNPSSLTSYRLGDGANRGGSWGRPVRFGGVQWATNFATQPGFVTFPTPGLRGEAALPATVDVYVNNALRAQREIPAGPFQIQNFPVVSGQGEVQLVVQDYLGRQTLIRQPYYVSPTLLKEGLQDFSYEAGTERENYASLSNSYGPAFASATHRLGITDFFTQEVHGEFLKDRQNLGFTSAVLVPFLGTVSGSAALSRNPQTGALLAASYDRQARRIGFGARSQFTTAHFAQLGQIPGTTPKLQTTGYFGVSPRGYAENLPVGRTSDSGTLLVPKLRSYDRNHLSIEGADLPIDAEVDSLDVNVVPYYRTGVFVRFPVDRVKSALVRLVREDGSEIPSGATVKLEGSSREFPVGLHGAAFVTGLAIRNRFDVEWMGGGCRAELTLPVSPEKLPELGPIVCKGARR